MGLIKFFLAMLLFAFIGEVACLTTLAPCERGRSLFRLWKTHEPKKTLATQGDTEISGIMWADVGGSGGFGGI